MTRFFTRERFGRPQFLAGILLLFFLAQALWLVHRELGAPAINGLNASEQVRIGAGWRQLHGGGLAGAPFPDPPGELPLDVSQDGSGFDTEHSPLLSLASAAPLLAWPQRLLNAQYSLYWRWLPRLPFLACGVFLGASLWYVARRLCGNTGGFLALTLYCFSPSMIQASAVWHTEPEILAAWGSFGAIFTAIAVAHTLYAPREVVLWNWRRIVLAGHRAGHRCGFTVFDDRCSARLRSGLSALSRAHSARRSSCDLGRCVAYRIAVLLFAIYFFNPHIFFRSNAARIFLGSHLARLHRFWRLPADSGANLAGVSCSRLAAARCHRNL